MSVRLLKAQEKWSLQRCVHYAMDSNISVRQNQLQARIADINYQQSKLSIYPSANFSNNDGYRFGKSQNPSTGILENQNFLSVGFSFQTSAEIFNFYSKRNIILANEWSALAAKANTDKLKNDIALTVANSYLQVLLAKEQEFIAGIQVQQSLFQFNTVTKQVNAGALPPLNALELESQLARDSANLIAARGNVAQAKYALKAYMSLDAAVPFEVEEPSADKIPIENIADLQPEMVYVLALANLPQQRANMFNLKAAQRNADAVRSALYPTLSAYGTLGSNYGYFKTPVYQQVVTGYSSSGLLVKDNSGNTLDVQRPIVINGSKTGYFTADAFGKQINNNFGQSIGINISVPIFNGGTARANYEKSKISILNYQLQSDLDNQTIKQNIYQAYNSALVALEKFNSSKKAVETAQRSYDYSLKRFNVGMLSTFELTTNQNNLYTSKLQFAVNQFDYVFKMKVLEFYKGQGIKL
ncbi:MAG: TolC family protein [Ginsengibacter sp.]